MKNKKGFAFIETIITVVILSATLLFLYSSYSSILSDEETRTYYDDPSFIYRTNYVKKFLEEYGNMDIVKNYYLSDTYVVNIGPSFKELFIDQEKGKSMLESITNNFYIYSMSLVKSDMFNNCYNITGICKDSLEKLGTYGMQKYVNSLNNADYPYYLVIEYSFKRNSDNSYIICTPGIDIKCKTYYTSVGVN